MLTNVGIRVVLGGSTETVEIRLKLPTADRSARKVDVLVNQHYHFFDNKQSYWQDFKCKYMFSDIIIFASVKLYKRPCRNQI